MIDAVLIPESDEDNDIIMSNGTFTTCEANFFDSGDASANYANNENLTLTFFPDQANSVIEVNFTSFDVEAEWDALYVYDGPDTNSPLISSGNPPTGIPGFPLFPEGGYYGNDLIGPFVSTHESGALTFVFRSDGSFNEEGWIATVSCVTADTPPNCAINYSPAENAENVSVNTTISASNGGGSPTGYDIYFGTDPLNLPLVAEDQETASYIPGTLELNTTYFYRIVPLNENGSAEGCPIISFTTESELNVNMFSGTITTCAANFFDSGGASANYSNNGNFTLTFFPDQANSLIEVNFTSFNVEAGWDALYVYDGPDTNSPLISSGNPPTGFPGFPLFPAGGYYGTNLIGPFSSSHPTGALTFVFRSDGTVNESGWEATVSCVEAVDPPLCANIISPADGAENVSVTTLINWSPGGGIVTGYNVYLGTDPLDLELVSEGQLTTSYNPGSLNLNTTYYYQIISFNDFGDAEDCAIISFTTEEEQNVNMQNGTIVTCDANFFDSGGPDGNYANNENLTLTFSPSQVGSFIKVEFTAFNTENSFDILRVYDGNSTNAPLIGFFTGTNLPESLTSSAANGSLTFNFISDGSGIRSGWEAAITCVSATEAPDCAINFNPANNAQGVNPSSSITWSPGGGLPTGYNVFFGTDPFELTLVSENQPETSYNAGLLESNTTYYYQIIPVNSIGEAEDCEIISFTTGGEVNINMQNGTFTTCSGNFFDSGGPNADYSANENYTLTLFPSTVGSQIEVTFTSFNVEPEFHALYIFDGPDINSPLISSGNPPTLSGFPAGGWYGEDIDIGSFTSSHESGALTFVFRTDIFGAFPGWEATISCVDPGQLPNCIINPIPADGAVDVSTTQIITWTSGGATDTYDVYFGTDENPSLVSENQSANSYNPGSLLPSTTYYWSVIPSNEQGSNVDCDQVYSFTTSSTINVNMSNGSVETCSANFYDNGGPNSNYSNNQNLTFTFFPDQPNFAIQVNFNSFNVEAQYDALYVYNGPDITSPLISSGNPPTLGPPVFPAGGYYGSQLIGPFISTHPTGALTFVFRSDGSVNLPGWSASVFCFDPAGAPNCPNITSGPSENEIDVCQNLGVFSWENGGGEVDGYLVYFGTDDNLEFVDTTSNTSFNAGFLEPNTTYQFQVTAFNENGESIECDVITFTTGECVTYCEAGSAFVGCDEFISNVLMGDINNISGCSQPGGYGDFTNLSTNVYIGSDANIIVTNGNPFAEDQLGVWIDWNQDGDFDDAGEQIPVTGSPGTGPYSATINPPVGASLGETRMRIRLTFIGAVNPCGITPFGEVEDYTILVNPELVCPFPNNLSATDLTTTSAVLNWDPQPLAIQYLVRYRLVTEDETVSSWVNPIVVDAPEASALIQGLMVAGSYQFQVASICDPSEDPIFSSSSFFKTVCFECPEGATPEIEVCGGTENNGCNVEPSAFQPITCGETICGTSFFDGTSRDTDWYSFIVTQPTVYTINAQAEFDYVLIFVNPNNCVNPTVITAAEFDACAEGELTTLLLPGSYSVFMGPQFDQSAFDCTSGGNTYYLTLNADIPPSFIFPVADVCVSSEPISLIGTPEGGTWSGTGIPNPMIGEFVPSISGVGEFVISYTTEANNCSSVATITINVVPNSATPEIPTGDVSICEGTQQSTYEVDAVDGATSYVWVLTPTDAGSIAGNTTSAIVNWNPNYSGNASIVVAAISGCGLGEFSASLDVDILSTPTAPSSVFGPIASCLSNTQLIAVGSVGASTYNWTVSPEAAGTFDGNGASVNFIGTAGFSGNVVISVTAENDCGESAAATFNLQVLPLPFADFVGLAAEYCDVDSPVALTGIPFGGIFAISEGNGIQNNIFSPSVAGAGTYDITYTITVGNCTNSNTQSVTVNAGPVVTFTAIEAPICRQDDAITLSATPEGGVFSGAGVSNSTFSPAVAGSGTHVITYTYFETGNSCPGIASQSVQVLQGPDVNLGPLSSTFCLNSSTEILTGSPALGTFTIDGDPATIFDPVAQGLGAHVVRYEVDNGTCVGFAQTTVTVIENISFELSNLDTAYCTNDNPVVLSSIPAGAIFSGPGVSNGVFNPRNAGTGTVTITAIYSDGNCTASITRDVVINSEPTALFSFNANGANVSFINNSVNATSYSWNFGDGNTSTAVNPTHTYDANGSYIVTLTASNPDCGDATYTAQILLTVGVGEIDGLDGIQLYPNPTRDLFTLSFNNSSRSDAFEIRITDAIGRLIHIENITGAGNFNKQYDISDKANGIYFLTITSNKGAVNYKIVKQ